MSILAFTAYLAMAYVVWFYLLMPHVELLEDAAWQLTKARRQSEPSGMESAPAAVASPSAQPAPTGQRPASATAPALRLRAA